MNKRTSAAFPNPTRDGNLYIVNLSRFSLFHGMDQIIDSLLEWMVLPDRMGRLY